MFFKIYVLKNFAIFTRKHLLGSLFNKVASLKVGGFYACNFFLTKDSNTVVFLWILRNISFLYSSAPLATSLFFKLTPFFSSVILQKQAILMWVLLPEFTSSSPKTGKNLTKIMLLSLLFALFFSYIISPIFKNKSSHYVSVWVPKNQRQHYLSEFFL